MKKMALAGAIALATIGSTLAVADEVRAPAVQTSAAAQGDVVITNAHIARLKAALKLTDAQKRYWPAIDAAFRQVVHRQHASADAGLIRRLRNRIAAITMDAMTMQQLASAAMPLLRTLDDDQKQVAMAFARSHGMGQLAAAF